MHYSWLSNTIKRQIFPIKNNEIQSLKTYFLLWIVSLFPLLIFLLGYLIYKVLYLKDITLSAFGIKVFLNYILRVSRGYNSSWNFAKPGKLFSLHKGPSKLIRSFFPPNFHFISISFSLSSMIFFTLNKWNTQGTKWSQQNVYWSMGGLPTATSIHHFYIL